MIYLFLADGFEEIEALAPVDFLRRAGVAITVVGMTNRTVCGAHGISVFADCQFDECSFSDAEGIILPGGMPGTSHLDRDLRLDGVLASVAEKNGLLAAICAAPMVLGKRGYLRKKEAICYPGFEEHLLEAEVSSKCVVRDGNVITAKSAGVAWEFAYRVAEYFVGTERCETVRQSLFLPSYGKQA